MLKDGGTVVVPADGARILPVEDAKGADMGAGHTMGGNQPRHKDNLWGADRGTGWDRLCGAADSCWCDRCSTPGTEPRRSHGSHVTAPGAGAGMAPPPPGRTDLLLRFFDSEFFDEWIALTYLHTSNSTGVHDYICNRMYGMQEDSVERYLLQLTAMAAARPGSAVERLMLDLCSRSLRIAAKTYWLFLSLAQDAPEDARMQWLRDRAEQSALEGTWLPPFQDPRTLSSPTRQRFGVLSLPWMASDGGGAEQRSRGRTGLAREAQASQQPSGWQPTARADTKSSLRRFDIKSKVNRLWGLSASQPAAGAGEDLQASSSSPSREDALSVSEANSNHYQRLRLELSRSSGPNQEAAKSDTAGGSLRGAADLAATSRGTLATGAEDDAESEVSSPRTRLRQTTFGATLDFVDALCEASNALNTLPEDQRSTSLDKGLRQLNDDIETAAEKGVMVSFPLSCENERVVRVPAGEAKLLNSREKAPFMLCVEVLTSSGPADARTLAPLRGGGLVLDASAAAPADRGGAVGAGYLPDGRPAGRRSPSLQADRGQACGAAGAPPRPQAAPGPKDRLCSLLEARPSFSKPIDVAMAGLRGETPIVNVSFVVIGDQARKPIALPGDSGRSAHATAGGAGVHGGGSLPGVALGGLRGWLCGKGDEDAGSRAVAVLSPSQLPYVKVKLEVFGGVDLHVTTSRRSGRRVPSSEALSRMEVACPNPLTAWRGGSSEHQLIAHLSRQQKRRFVDRTQEAAHAVFGERWSEKQLRIAQESPHSCKPGWTVRQVIVKSGDDCRQELLAVQLIRKFHDIFTASGLPLWLKPYEVLVTSSRTAFIEVVPDALSLHVLKSRLAPNMSLRDYFHSKYGKGTRECTAAQYRFVESMAAYSIVSYLLQLKDRHNGNILLDDAGHVIHIDFGFMLSNSPGGINFESAPFKLTRELLEVMDSDSEGRGSELFDYFKVLCIQGFLACRKHSDHILLLVEMMSGCGFPCFKAGPSRVMSSLRKRFHPSLTEEQCVEVVLGLISDSLDAWRTRQYDYYQRILNGIL
uniref:1-phosphatidylinositol 4-kinase n=1 Tax=Tetraselmis sp. GSL018 TaxID=582737 RepID=A0A061QT63_9CHLO